MIEAVMLWNEPNNLSHWDFEIDPDWSAFANMVKLAAQAIRAENPRLPIVLGGISPIDPAFVKRMEDHGALAELDVVALHGFPLDWNHWTIHEWPDKVAEIRAVTDKPIWISEVGASSFGAEEVQEFGLKKTAELLLPRLDHVYWYSLFDLPRAWPATTRHEKARARPTIGISIWGCIAKMAARSWSRATSRNMPPQWASASGFTSKTIAWKMASQKLKELGVQKLRTGLSWADYGRPECGTVVRPSDDAA